MADPIVTATPETTNPAPAAPTESPAAATPPETPTFDVVLKNPAYQAEFDRRIAKALKTAEEKAAAGGVSKTTVEELKAQLDKQTSQLADYMHREAAIKAGVDARFLDFVTFAVRQSVTDSTDYATALDAYIKANPQYVAQQAPAPAPGAWGKPQVQPPEKPDASLEDVIKAKMFGARPN